MPPCAPTNSGQYPHHRHPGRHIPLDQQQHGHRARRRWYRQHQLHVSQCQQPSKQPPLPLPQRLAPVPGTPVSFTITVTPKTCRWTTLPTRPCLRRSHRNHVTFTSPSGNPTYAWTNNNIRDRPRRFRVAETSVSRPPTWPALSPPLSPSRPTENGCAGTAQTFTITVNPAASVNQPANVSGCAGQPETVNFSGSSGGHICLDEQQHRYRARRFRFGKYQFHHRQRDCARGRHHHRHAYQPCRLPRHPGDVHHHRQPGPNHERPPWT
jgi:hypothetical protein